MIIEDVKESFIDLFDHKFISGVLCGGCGMAYMVLLDVVEKARYDYYALFLATFGSYLAVVWWYPIYKKEQENKQP